MTSIYPELTVARRAVRLCVLLSVLCAMLAAYRFLSPTQSSGRGIAGSIQRLVALVAGPYAGGIVWLIPCVSLLAFARFVWRRTAKRPADRWL
jgi:type IV secretory pathway VirB2 component (pilin)